MSQPFWWLIRHSSAGGGHAGGVLKVWMWWERLYLWRHHVRPLRKHSVLRIELRRHRGNIITLADGVAVHAGDRIVEIHLDNQTVAADVGGETWSPFRVVRSARSDLKILTRSIATGALGPVVAVHAVSLVAPALARLGFEVKPLERTFPNRLLHFYLVGLLAVYHPDGWEAAGPARESWPSEAWISVEHLSAIT